MRLGGVGAAYAESVGTEPPEEPYSVAATGSSSVSKCGCEYSTLFVGGGGTENNGVAWGG